MKNNKSLSKRKSWGRKIPGFIAQLTLEDGVSPEDKFYLSVIYHFSDVFSSDEETYTPSNTRLAKEVNCGQTKESAQWHISKLEKLGFLQTNHLKRGNKKIIVTVPKQLKPGIHPDGIFIDKILMQELDSCTSRLVAAVEIGFIKMSLNNKCKKIGISRKSYLRNLDKLEENKDLERFRKIITNVKALDSNDKALSHNLDSLTDISTLPVADCSNSDCTRVKRGIVFISRDINNNVSLAEDQTLSYREMVSKTPMYVPNPVATSHLDLAVQVRIFDAGSIKNVARNCSSESLDPILQETLRMTKSQISHLKNTKITAPVKKKKKQTKKPPVKPSPELQMIYKFCPMMTMHQLGSAAQLRSERVIKGLKNGLCTEFPEYLNVIIDKGAAQKLKRSEILLAFKRSYTLKERKEIYQRLNNVLSPGFWPKVKSKLPRNLWDALSHSNNFSGVSWLMYCILREPMTLEKAAVVDVTWEVDAILRRWPKTRLQNDIPELKRALGFLNKYYYGEFLVPYYDRETVIGGMWGTWENYLNGFLNFLDERYPGVDKNPGWFKPRSRPVRAWEREMKRISEEIDRQNSVNSSGYNSEYQYAQ